MRCPRPLVTVALTLLLSVSPASGRAELGEWTSLGPEGGNVEALAIDPVTSTTVYAGTGGGVLKTTDGGATWAPASEGLTTFDVRDLAIDPLVPTTVYVATTSGGVFKSVDAGATWTPKNSGASSFISWLAIDPVTPSTVYARGTNGVVKTTNAGVNWLPSNTGIPFAPNGRGIVIDPVTPSTVYSAGVGIGVYKTVNGAASWSASNTGLTDLEVFAIAVDPLASNTLFVGTCGGTPSRGIFKSVDGGATWSSSNAGLDPSPCVEVIRCDPMVPGVVYAATIDGGGFKSVDGGVTWTLAQTGAAGRRLQELAIDPTNSATIYAGSLGGGVFKSTDSAATWTQKNTGVHAYPITAITFDPTAPSTLYLGTYSDETTETVFRSIDGGATWTPRGPVPENEFLVEFGVYSIAVDASDPLTIYAGSDSGIFKTTDGGLNWTGPPAYRWITALIIDPNDSSTIYSAANFGDGIQKSTDAGATWVDATTGLTDLSVSALVMSPQNHKVLYAATDDGVFRTSNGGAGWSPRTNGMGAVAVRALAIDPTDGDVLYAGSSSSPTRLFTSTDGGDQWSDHGSFPVLTGIAIDPDRPEIVYAATVFGVQKSVDHGTMWSALNTGLSDRRMQAIVMDPADSARVFAGTLGGGVYVIQSVCAADGDCDDDDLCTIDTCVPDDVAADGDGCVYAQVQCDAQCHEQSGFCDAGTGLCEWFSATLPDGTPCDDDDACTFDRCLDGVCTGNPTPRGGCFQALSSKILIKNSSAAGKDLIKWRWSKGASTTIADYADPRTSAQYTLCVYDRSGPGGDPALVIRARPRPTGPCAGEPCWSAVSSGYKYRDREALPNGLTSIRLKAGATGAAKIILKGKGLNLSLPPLPLDATVTAQLVKSHGLTADACWDAHYSGIILRNDTEQFKANGD
jgi:photosystem II stability/assembly factor-like uncharacterized protein